MCKGISVPLPLFHVLALHKANLTTLLNNLVKVWLYKQTYIIGLHINHWTQLRSALRCDLCANPKQADSVPIRPWVIQDMNFGEDSRISEYLGKHEFLSLSGNTDDLCLPLTHTLKHTQMLTHTQCCGKHTVLAGSSVQMVFHLHPS